MAKSVEREPEETEDSADEATLPLAWNLTGDPVDVPDSATGWRVSWRKNGERGGSPTLVHAAGRPLIVPLDITAEELAEQVGGKAGRYRLDPVDESGRVIPGSAPAYSVFEKPVNINKASVPTPATATIDDHLSRALATLDQMSKTVMDAMIQHTTQMAAVVTAMSGAVMPASRRQHSEPIEITMPAVEQSAPAGFDWGMFLQTVMPSVQAAMAMWTQRMAAPPTPPTAAQ